MMNVDILRQMYNRGEKLEFEFFFRSDNPFSQWYLSNFEIDGVKYSCMEQYMMAEKARLFKDYDIEKEIMKATIQKDMKGLGRLVKGFDNDIWDKHKVGIIIKGNLAKFSQNKVLLKKLLSTGSKILVEASPWDKIWGIGLSADNISNKNPNSWRGKNLLGFALMEVRKELKGLL